MVLGTDDVGTDIVGRVCIAAVDVVSSLGKINMGSVDCLPAPLPGGAPKAGLLKFTGSRTASSSKIGFTITFATSRASSSTAVLTSARFGLYELATALELEGAGVSEYAVYFTPPSAAILRPLSGSSSSCRMRDSYQMCFSPRCTV